MENNEITGRAKGGKATAEKMTPEELHERAKKGAIARWGPRSEKNWKTPLFFKDLTRARATRPARDFTGTT